MPTPRDITSIIVENREVNPKIFLLSLNTSDLDIWSEAEPGQFAMLKIADMSCDDPLLRRPLSIHNVRDGKIQFLYKVLGRGTLLLSQAKPGTALRILAPLGNGFSISNSKTHCLVGGGMGIAPLLYFARKMKEQQPSNTIKVLLGARTKNELIAVQDFTEPGLYDVKIATDDGSEGHHGLVTDLLDGINASPGDMTVYCCGPHPMMKAVSNICRKKEWKCQISLEALMACGMGACLGCAVPKKGIGIQEYLHVCSDGPVFKAEEIW
ncbi:MAG: dihydroorotate dehydrogenase electron transfer subunit [Desulfobulbaceae bacterium]|uniref:Dihydroorotate dehydrogenase B (NAD(+)), electron transfer subunit n=1 Tax=Candidatus Desulfobia pelagia TaxID=2841692 RepID=A0A8J6NEM7_9BACT|nr:dihydroorotate dehydrogenase electron transfer subunit [Candidatus Desulfobia pelagia]